MTEAAKNPHYTSAESLLAAWEKTNAPLGGAIKKQILDAVSLYIERENAPSQAHYTRAFEQLTNSLSAVRKAKTAAFNGMEIYAGLIQEWNRQNPPQPTDLQASLAWHRERGLLLPTPG